MPPIPLDRLDRGRQVTRIVKCIENAENIDSIFTCQMNEFVDNIVGVISISHKILPTQQHLKRCVFSFGFDSTQTLPWVFAKEPEADIESRPSPDFERIVPDTVDYINNP